MGGKQGSNFYVNEYTKQEASMKWFKWIGIMSALLLIVSCFTPWVYIAMGNITVSGIDSTGTSFGKPGLLHFILSGIYILFMLVPKIWTKRANLLVCAFNLGWSIRNFIIISACYMGECPQKKSGLYLIVIASSLMLLASFFPDMKLKEEEEEASKN